MKLSSHFSRSEFACSCGCGFDTVDHELLLALEHARLHFDQPITVTSGCRCFVRNEQVGGSPKSQHLLGRAADIQVKNVHPEDVYHWFDITYRNFGIGLYDTFVHVDSRGEPARWDMTQK